MQIEYIELNAKEVELANEAYVYIRLYKISPKHCLFFAHAVFQLPAYHISKCAVFIIFVFGMNLTWFCGCQSCVSRKTFWRASHLNIFCSESVNDTVLPHQKFTEFQFQIYVCESSITYWAGLIPFYYKSTFRQYHPHKKNTDESFPGIRIQWFFGNRFLFCDNSKYYFWKKRQGRHHFAFIKYPHRFSTTILYELWDIIELEKIPITIHKNVHGPKTVQWKNSEHLILIYLSAKISIF